MQRKVVEKAKVIVILLVIFGILYALAIAGGRGAMDPTDSVGFVFLLLFAWIIIMVMHQAYELSFTGGILHGLLFSLLTLNAVEHGGDWLLPPILHFAAIVMNAEPAE